jgi:adhesin/invasin
MRNLTHVFAHSLVAIALGALVAGCGGKKKDDSSSNTTAPITSGASSQLVLLSGGNQTAEVGTTFAQPIRVLAQDAQGSPLAGVQVMFQPSVDALGQGNLDGTLSVVNATTGQDGTAETFLTTSTVAGGNHVRVMAPDLTGAPLLVRNFGIPAPASALAIESGDAQQAVAGQNAAAPIVVSVTDSFGNAVPDTQVTFAVATGDAIVLTPSTVTDAGGLAQTLVTAGQTAGDSTITASVAGIAGQLTFTVTSTPDVASQLVIVSGDAQSAVAGSALPAPCVVGVRDQFNNAIADSTVTFAAATGGGSLSATTVTTGVDGNASTVLTLGVVAGTNTVTATVAGVTPVTFTVTGTAGAAATLAIVSGDNQTGIAGSALGAPLVVSAVDANANPVANFMVQFTVIMGNGQLAAAAVPTNAQGQAQVAYTLGVVAGANQVQATGTGINTPILFNALGTAGPAAVMQIASGNNQTGLVGTALAQPFVVLVTDVNGNAVQNAQVAFVVAAGGGTLSAATVATNAQGNAASTLTLGAVAGTNTVTATSGNLTQTFTATGGAGAATQIALTSGNNQTGNAGAPLQPFVVTVRDAGNNPVAGFSVTFAVTAGGGTLSAATVATDAQGNASTVLTLGAVAGPNAVTANATGLTGSPITFAATGAVGPAANLALVSGNAQSGTVNTLLPQALTVRVTDAAGNAVQGTTVLWTVAAGGGTLSAASAVSDAQGLASVRYTLGNTVATNTVQASSGNLNGSPVSFTSSATAAVATTLTLVSGDAQTGTAGAPLANMIALRVTDANNNPVAGFTVGFAVASGGGQVSAASVMTNNMGLALVSWTLGTVAGPNSLTVTGTGLAGSPMTLTATGVAGPAATLAIASGNNQSGLVGTALAQPFVITSTDANGNVVANVPVTFAVATGGGSLSVTSTNTDANGQASTVLTLGAVAGANTVTASSTGLTGATFTAMGTALPATTLTMVSGNNQTGTVATALAQPFVVRVTNANNQPVQGFSVGFAVATGGGTLSAATVTTDAQGNAATTLTLGAAPGANTVTVTATGLAGSPMTFSAMGNVGAAATLAISAGNNQSGIAGSALTNPFVVLVTDANNNPVPGASVAFAVTAGGGTLSAATVSTNAQGLASSTLTLGAAPATNTVTATVQGVTPVTFTATGMAAPPAAVVVVSGNNQSARIGMALTDALVVRVVDANNNPLSGQSVAFTVVTGGGALSAASATTNAQGQCSVNYTVGANLGANTVRATVTGITPVDFTAMGTALTYVDDLQPVLAAKCLLCHMPGGVAAAFPLTTYDQVRNGTSLLNVSRRPRRAGPWPSTPAPTPS